MTSVLVLLRKDFAHFLRNKAAVVLTFVIPFVMIFLFGQIFGINRKDSGPSGIPLAVVNASANPGAAKLVESLRAEKSFRVITEFTNSDQSKRPLAEADLRALMEAPGAPFRFAVIFPADLVNESEIGLKFKIFSNPRNEIETQTVNGLLQRTIFSNVPQLLGESLKANARNFIGQAAFQRFNRAVAAAVAAAYGGDPAEIEARISAGDFLGAGVPAATAGAAPAAASSSPASDVLQNLVRIETVQVVGAKVKSPAATAIVGGWAIQFLLFAVSASATRLFRERDAGIFQRLLAAPVTRAHILWSTFL